MEGANQKEKLQRNKIVSSSQKGLFWILGGIIFLLQGMLYLNDAVSGFLLVALQFIYVFAFPEQKTGNQPTPLLRNLFNFLGRVGVFLIVAILVLLIWVWLWQITKIHVPFLAAITCTLFGLVQIVWGFVRAPDKLAP